MKFICSPIKKLNEKPHVKDVSLDDILNKSDFSSDLGTFIIGKNKLFHGGVNLNVPDNHAVQCVADGKVIAYRIMDDNCSLEYKGKKIEFSNSFVLIEHDYSELKFSNILERNIYKDANDRVQVELKRNIADSVLSDYKFYSLYMHLAPVKEIIDRDLYPDWIYLDKKKNKKIIKGTKIESNILFKKGFAIVEFDGSVVKLSKNDLVLISGSYYLNKEVEFYESNGEDINEKILKNRTVVLDENERISVSSGDLLGYGGKSQGAGIEKVYKSTVHFEIWLDNIEFMKNNLLSNSNSIVKSKFVFDDDLTNPNLKYNQKLNNLFYDSDKRALGYCYLNKSNLYYENLNIYFKEKDFENYVIRSEYVKDRFYFDFHSKGRVDYKTYTEEDFLKKFKSKVRILSDADWFSKPVNNWLLKRQSDFFLKDGKFNYNYFKNNHSEWLKYNQRMVVELEYNEWDDTFFKKKYSFLLNKNEYYPQLKKKEFNFLENYQNKMSFYSSIKKSSKYNNLNKIYIVHPIVFLQDLKRCVLPALPSIDSDLMKKILQYSLDELVFLLNKVVIKLEEWLVSYDAGIDKLFSRWFGYSKFGNNNFTEIDIQGKQDKYTDEIKPIYFTYYLESYIEPIEIDSYDIAKRVLVENFRQVLRKMKKISINNFWYSVGNMFNLGAFVDGSDFNLNINLGMAIFTNMPFTKDGKIVNDNLAQPSFSTDEKTGSLGFVGSILHECFHLPSEKEDIIDKGILPYLNTNLDEIYHLNDLSGVYFERNNEKIYLVGYAHEKCLEVAKLLPHVALIIADSHALFFAELVELCGGRPKIEYL